MVKETKYKKIDKEEYYRISEKGNYPKRCPILSKCQRRAYTLYLCDTKNFSIPFTEFQATLIKNGILKKDVLPMVGESPEYAGGTNNWGLFKICPEVSLFEPEIIPFKPRGLAVTAGSYDKYFTNEDKTEIHNCGHFSECAEYNEYTYSQSQTKEDIIEVKPNIWGIGINFNAIYRWIFKKGRNGQ